TSASTDVALMIPDRGDTHTGTALPGGPRRPLIRSSTPANEEAHKEEQEAADGKQGKRPKK
ncbi:MAG: hypothetical protein P8Q48_12090, partial [Paracoccaceae bacterium]|nr:hypothetical protein [Paracoccaceae bacterium]